jgi:hypothetical protein
MDDVTLLTAALARRAGEAAPAQRMADTVVDVLHKLETALEPVIGLRGVAALLERSLHGAAAHHAWLAEARDAFDTTKDLAPLVQILATRTPEESGAAGAEVLQAFHDLLVSLVGHSLTRRLVGGVWSELLGDPPLQDSTP